MINTSQIHHSTLGLNQARVCIKAMLKLKRIIIVDHYSARLWLTGVSFLEAMGIKKFVFRIWDEISGSRTMTLDLKGNGLD